MIWRLEYCNKYGDTARLDIQRGASMPIEVIEGADNPFSLKYKLDASNKTGYFMSSSAEISIFETATFNIDELKTSNETELKVNYYVNSDLKWTGFILPDFFSRVIGEPAIVEMTATDRLGTLKGVTLTGLTAKVTLRSLLEQSLLKTGISLPVQYDAQISESGTNVFDTEILSQRIVDTRGRNISCYDIIKSILVATNSTIRQRDGKWQIYNKLEHESVAPSITFNEVEKGARRTIQPVASSVGIFQELGGGQIYPDNYNFINGLSDWALGGSSPSFVPENRNVMGYTTGGMPIYGDSGFFSIRGYNSADPVLVTPETNPHIKSNPITIQTNDAASVKVNVDVNATGQNIATNIFTVIVFAEKVGEKLAIDQSGVFTKYSSDINKVGQFYHNVVIYDKGKKNIDAVTVNKQISGVLTADNVNDYKITVLITGTWLSAKTVFINSVATTFSSTVDTTKGNIFKTNQGVNFTREHEIDTTIFGDYIARGINGYFYKYMPDDTSSLMLTDGSFTDLWTAFGSSEQLPLLQHMTRQKSKMFSIAHDILSATIETQSFDPLAIYQSCDGEKWVIIEANYDFLRSNVDVVLEQIKYGALEKRDFIYSYFGDGESGISSVGGISGGGTGTGGGGMTAEQIELLNTVAGYWTLDENGNLKTTYNAYSEQELSAYGFGSGGSSGGGGLIETVYGYSNLGGTFSNSDLNNTFNAYTINQLHLRIATLEAGGGTGWSVEWADILNKPSWIGATKPSYSWSEITGKPSTFPPSAHTHTKSQITDFAHTHPFTEITGIATASQIPDLAISKITGLQTALDSKLNKSVIDDFFEWDAVNNAIKAKYTFYSTGELSAYGIGSGGSSGGGVELLQAWADYDATKDNWAVKAGLLVPFYNDMQSRVGALEAGGGGGGSNVTWGTESGGYILLTVEGVSKSVALSTHTHSQYALTTHNHSGVYEPAFTKNTAFNKDFGTTSGTVAEGNHTHTFASLTSKPTTLAGYEITDAYTKTEVDTALDGKASLRTRSSMTDSYRRFVIGVIRLDGEANAYSIAFGTITMSRVNGFFPNKRFDFSIQKKYNVKAFEGNVLRYNSFYTFRLCKFLYNGVLYGGFDIYVQEANITSIDFIGQSPNWVVVEYYNTSSNTVINSEINDSLVAMNYEAGSFYANGDTIYSSGNLTSLSQLTDNIGVATHIANTSNPHSVTKAQVGLGNVDNTADSAKNVLSATKLQTARTIWGQSFDGSGNVTGALTSEDKIISGTGKGFRSAGYQTGFNPIWAFNNAETYGLGYYQGTHGLVGVTGDAIGFHFGSTAAPKVIIDYAGSINMSGVLRSTLITTGNTQLVTASATRVYLGNPMTQLYLEGSGTPVYNNNTLYHAGNLSPVTTNTAQTISGAKTFSSALTASISVTTPKVIFAAAGWSVEQSGTEIQFKYNGVIKQRLLNDGSIVGIGEITAFGSTT